MQDSTTREKILKKIRQALIHKTNQRFPNIDWDKNIYVTSDESLEEQFAKSFTKIGGQFVFCENELEFLEHLVGLAEERGWKLIHCRRRIHRWHARNLLIFRSVRTIAASVGIRNR